MYTVIAYYPSMNFRMAHNAVATCTSPDLLEVILNWYKNFTQVHEIRVLYPNGQTEIHHYYDSKGKFWREVTIRDPH